MKIIRNTLTVIVLILNVLIGIGLLGGAYAQYLSPVLSPVLSIAGLGFPFFAVLNLLLLIIWLIIRPKFSLLPILFFVLSIDALLTYCPLGLSKDSQGGTVLKVLTYNTMGMHEKETKDKSKQSVSALEYIKTCGADIVCLQEFPMSHADIVRQLKSVYPHIKVVLFKSGLEVACLSKTPILSGEQINLISPGNGAALFYVQKDEKKIPVIVNHLESNKLSGDDKEIYQHILEDPQNRFVKSGSKHLLFKLADAAALRGPQAKVIANRVQSINSPYTIVCGDFNDVPLSYTHRVIAEELQDTYREAAFGPGVTYHEHFMFFRIDHILVGKGYRVLKCKIDSDIDASDHYPYWCEIEF